MLDDYLNVMYWRNELHTFVANDQSFDGTIIGLDDLGRLKVSTAQGERVFGVLIRQFRDEFEDLPRRFLGEAVLGGDFRRDLGLAQCFCHM